MSTLPEQDCLGGAEGTRTPDPHTASVVRYQLRHSPKLPGKVTKHPWPDLIDWCGRLSTGPVDAAAGCPLEPDGRASDAPSTSRVPTNPFPGRRQQYRKPEVVGPGTHAALSARAASRTSNPASTSLPLTVNGGAIRKMPPMPGNWTMFMCSPRFRQDSVTA